MTTARTANKKQEAAPTPAPAPTPLDPYDFSSFDVGVEIPAIAHKANRPNSLPFPALYSAMLPAALEGKQPHRFVPRSYWTDVRGASPATVAKVGYEKTKLRDSFNRWQAEDEAARAGVILTTVARDGKSEEFPEPGVSIWMERKAP